MIYNLDERATLSESGARAAEGTLREMIALALTWGDERLAAARIETVTQEVYGADGIAEIASTAGIAADADEGHPS